MEHLMIPGGDDQSALNLHDTQQAIKTVKDFFQQNLVQRLNLLRALSPLPFSSPPSPGLTTT